MPVCVVKHKYSRWMNVPILLLLIASIVPHLLHKYWWLELLVHFKVQYFVLLVLFGGLCLISHRKIWVLIIVLIGCLWNIYFILPFYIPQSTSANDEGLTIVTINLLRENQEVRKVENYLKETDPDIVILLEYSNTWKSSLSTIANSFETVSESPRPDNFGIAVFCKGKMETTVLQPKDLPLSFILRGRIRGIPLKLIATHPVPPVGQLRYQRRNLQLALLSEHLKSDYSSVILAGDLNTTSFSPFFQQLLSKNPHMMDSREGFGIQTTWPVMFPPVGITLDHILVSQNLEVLDHRTGPDIGSDHLPVQVRLRVRP